MSWPSDYGLVTSPLGGAQRPDAAQSGMHAQAHFFEWNHLTETEIFVA